MDAYKWAAVVVVGWGFGSAVVAVFTGRFIADWRDHCAQFARQQQAEQIRRAHEDAEHSERLWAELEQR